VLALYNILATLLWPLLWFYPPFRGTLKQRMGDFELGDYNPDAEGTKFLINAVSAGEVVAISSMLSELKRAVPDSQTVLLTTTESGQEMARTKAAGGFDLLAFFPLIDLWFVVRRFLDKLKPDVYITTESELWPNMQEQCRRRGIPVILVNARIYLHNKQGWRGSVVRRLYEQVDLVVCQDELQRKRFIEFGLTPKQLAVSGNIKFDFAAPGWESAQEREWQARWGRADWTTIVAGSTHEGEEELLCGALATVRAATADYSIRLIIAPRHVERTAAVVELAHARGFDAATMAAAEAREHAGSEWDVLVVDRYGVLVDIYRLADVVVMGGTFHPKVGGHNLLEATMLGKPVVVGPHTYSIVSQVEMLSAADALFSCPLHGTDGSAASAATQLGGYLAELLADRAALADNGARAKEITLRNRGAARRAVELVLEHVGIRATSAG